MMNPVKISSRVLATALAAVALGAYGGMASAVTTAPVIYGSLGNFDVVNNTGQPCNGFEIELEGLSPGEVVYAFGDSGGTNPVNYIRYGKPQILRNQTGTGTIVRYASPYLNGKFTEATPVAPSPTPATMGHQCWVYGDPNYPNSGCEHFGLSLLKNPTTTTYRWLVGDNATGTLKVVGSPGNPNIPAPVHVPPPAWNVNQNPPQLPNDPPLNAVVAVVQAPPAPPVPPGGKGEWGEAIWMKIYKTELPEPAELDDLLLGGNVFLGNPPIVPGDQGEPPEIEWQLLQSPPLGKVGNWEKGENGQEAGDGSESVLRRYEYYKYTGQYDQEDSGRGEARCDNPTAPDQQVPDRCGTPVNGVAGVGDLLGSQNGAANLVPLCASDVTPSIAVKRGGYSFNFTTRLYSQRVTLTNTGASAIFGPISLVLDNLTLGAGDGLFNRTGMTICAAPLDSPYIDTSINLPVASLAPNASVTVVLQFRNQARTSINYTARVLSTAGSR